MCNNNDACSEISEVLAIINVLQQNACSSGECLETCDRGFLGCNGNALVCNTRPVQLFLCNGQQLSMPISKDDTTTDNTSSVFRVEKIEGCSATFRVLAPSTEAGSTYTSTNSFFTVNLKCVCCLRCLSDTHIDCV